MFPITILLSVSFSSPHTSREGYICTDTDLSILDFRALACNPTSGGGSLIICMQPEPEANALSTLGCMPQHEERVYPDSQPRRPCA